MNSIGILVKVHILCRWPYIRWLIITESTWAELQGEVGSGANKSLEGEEKGRVGVGGQDERRTGAEEGGAGREVGVT